MTLVKDKAEGGITSAYHFDGLDESREVRNRVGAAPSVPEGQEIVVGSYRLYLPQTIKLPDGSEGMEHEIVERDDWLVWDVEDARWAIYPPKLFEKYFEVIPEDEGQ